MTGFGLPATYEQFLLICNTTPAIVLSILGIIAGQIIMRFKKQVRYISITIVSLTFFTGFLHYVVLDSVIKHGRDDLLGFAQWGFAPTMVSAICIGIIMGMAGKSFNPISKFTNKRSKADRQEDL